MRIKHFLNQVGPGFMIAATGIGAGDMVTATVGGARYGTIILWASIIGALLKYVLNEGIARWQLVTGSSVILGWVQHFHKGVSIYFIVYLVLWSFVVAGALMASCGLAAYAFFPQLSIALWGCIHAVAGALLVLLGRYQLLENLMKFFIALMFVTIISNLFLMKIDWLETLQGIILPRVPEGGAPLVLGIIGGVGGSVTLLCYGYWLKEKGWNDIKMLAVGRKDLGISYGLTGLFGMAIILLAAEVNPEVLNGNQIILAMADKLGETAGSFGRWIFMIGFWGAVFSSLLGVWSGVPYLFHDFMLHFKKTKEDQPATRTRQYKAFLLFLTFPPMALLFLEKPVWIIILYSVAGAFFMPFLASLLLVMNNTRKWIGAQKNSALYNLLLIVTLLLFLYLLISQVLSYL